MLKRLKNLFSTFTLRENCRQENIQNYQWFITADQMIFGIAKTEITARDLQLLKAFTEPYDTLLPAPTAKEKQWWELISSCKEETLKQHSGEAPYRFVYFIMPEKHADPESFIEALYGLFGYKVPILWLHSNEGIVIEEMKDIEDQISYSQIIDILMSDLYIHIKFLTGPFQTNVTKAPEYYQQLIALAQNAFKNTDKDVLSYMDAVIFSLLSESNASTLKSVSVMALQEFVDDQQFLETLTAFFQCNLNLSEAAKQLYMHRNSLQYRLDKFKQKTGLDVRDFHQAVTVYLAILFKHTK